MSLSSLLMLTIHQHAAFLGTLHIGGQQGRAIQLCLAVSQKWFNLHLTFTWSTLSSLKYMTGRDILKISMKLHRICKLWREKMYLKNVSLLKTTLEMFEFFLKWISCFAISDMGLYFSHLIMLNVMANSLSNNDIQF